MKIGFIGMGNMAYAIASGIVSGGFIKGEDVNAFDVNKAQLDKVHEEYGMIPCDDEVDLVNKSDVVFFAVKPNVIDGVCVKVKDALKGKMVISIVNAYSFDMYNERLDASTRHLTVMPNTPARVKAGMTLLEKENSLTEDEFKFAKDLFNTIGETVIVPSHLMKAGGAVNGCGPAFVYMMIEALADGAVLNGIPRDTAYKLASATVLGSAKMQLETGLHPGILKDQVCSPGGITIKGVKALEENNFRNAVIEAVMKAK